MDRYRLGIITQAGKIYAMNFTTIDEAEGYILSLAEKEKIKHYRILDKEINQIVSKGDNL